MRRVLKPVLIVLAALLLLGGAFIAYRLATADFTREAPLPALKASTDPAIIAQGRYVANALAHCSACHGPGPSNQKHELGALDDLRGGFEMNAGPFGRYYPANLTPDPETGIGNIDDAHLARAIRHGVSRTGTYAPLMAFAVGVMADEDLVAVLSYLRSLPPVRNATKQDEYGPLAKLLADRFQPHDGPIPAHVPPGGPSVERGAYIANGPGLCYGCHTPVDPLQGFKPVGPRFSGAHEPDMPGESDPGFENVPINLTPDPATGHLANWSEDRFVERFRAGALFRGTRMPWDNFKQMTDDDLRSLYRYFKTLAPVVNETGPNRRPEGWTPTG